MRGRRRSGLTDNFNRTVYSQFQDTAEKIYERRKADQWKHPVIGHSLSYARLIELEVRLLEKEWMDEGGLFARIRLR